jgi:hypothetical protein
MSKEKKRKVKKMQMSDEQQREIMDALAITLEILTEPGELTHDRRRDAASAIRLIYYFFETEFRGGR